MFAATRCALSNRAAWRIGAGRPCFKARLSPDGFSLVMHLAIFWGMVVLAIGTALATVDQDFTNLLLDFQVLRGELSIACSSWAWTSSGSS